MLCSSCSEESGEYGPIVDLDTVLQDYAWRELKRDARWYQGPLLRRSYYDIEIPWNFYEFEHKTTRFSARIPHGSTLRQDFREKKQVELFSTDYKNNTAKEQIYNLKTQRQTQARTHISFQRGFVIKNNANFKLKIPDHYGHCGVTSTADGHLRVTKREENIQELFTWQCDSDITVDPYHITKVTLMVTEDEFMADFEVRSRLRMPTGEAPIILKRKRDNHIHAVMLLSDLRDVFADLNHPNITVSKEKIGSNTETIVEFITTGTLESVRWSDQRVCIESKPIDPSSFSDSLYDSAICSSDVYSKVIKHATKNPFDKEQNTILATTTATTPNEKKNDFQGFKVETKDMRFSIIPKIITENPDEFLDKASKLEEQSQVRSVFPTIRLQEKERRMSDPEGQRPPPPYKSVSDLPLKVIRETSLEDKDKSEVGTPDSSDSQKFSKVTSV